VVVITSFGPSTGLPHQNPDDDDTHLDSAPHSTRIGKASIPFESPWLVEGLQPLPQAYRVYWGTQVASLEYRSCQTRNSGHQYLTITLGRILISSLSLLYKSTNLAMLAPQSPEPCWSHLPSQAAERQDGGPRSFPKAKDAEFSERYTYVAHHEPYQRLFFRKTAGPSSNPSNGYSAGWLIPDDTAGCNPVFVAHSTLAALWLLRETLPNNTVSDATWEHLARGAYLLSQDTEEDIPPSAQRRRTKRPAPPDQTPGQTPDQTPTPKRARADLASDASSPVSLPPDPSSGTHRPSEGADVGSGPTRITTVTNNNRREERRREQKRKAQALKKRRAIGLIAPPADAPPAEHFAYDSLDPKDESGIAWILKQPVDKLDFYQTARSPYATAISMLEKAYALGNPAAQYHAASFIQCWRSRGTPFPTRTTPSSSPGNSSELVRRTTLPSRHNDSLSPPSNADSFRHAWDTVNHYEGQLAAVHIQYRWAMAFLGRTYAEKIDLLKQEDQAAGRGQNQSRDGKGRLRTEAMASLLPLVYDKVTFKEKNIFKKRLHRATRWYEVAHKLGWGSLCLMPHDLIPNTWVEQTLRVRELPIWLALVEKVNSDACTASKALDTWLGSESIAGGPIDGKQALRIEAELPTTIYEVEEVQDSEGSEGDEDSTPTQPRAIVLSAEPTRPWRQLTLLELLKPPQ